MTNNSNNSRTTKRNVDKEYGAQAFNPTKSKVGRLIILILALGMFVGMIIAAIIEGIKVLS